MKRCIIIALASFSHVLVSMGQTENSGQQGPPEVPLPAPLMAPTGRPWLGLKLTKVDLSTSSQIRSLPAGIGFVVKAIDAGGPAEGAEFQPFDVVWKLGDQMLVNEAQLATLLRLHKPGDEVMLSIFRGGQPLEILMKLGDLPVGRDGFSSQLAEAAILPGETMRVVNIADRTATYTIDEGKVVLRKDGESYQVVISNPKNEIIFQGNVTTREQAEEVPEDWRRRVFALRRGLDHQIQGVMEPVRAPRPRVVPVPSTEP